MDLFVCTRRDDIGLRWYSVCGGFIGIAAGFLPLLYRRSQDI